MIELLVLMALGIEIHAKPLILHVSPAGNDRWSGRADNPLTNGQDGPVASLQAALTLARKAPAGEKEEGVTILLREGHYSLTAPIALTPQDSGAGSSLLIAAFPGETPIVSGGRRIMNWERVAGEGNLWRAKISSDSGAPWLVHALFLNGQRCQRARTPNDGFFRIVGKAVDEKPLKLRFKPGDLKATWAADGNTELIALLAWSDVRMQIRAVDESANILTLSGDARPSNREENARYYIENAPDGLDAPGEWYQDVKSGTVTYYARPGEDMAKVQAIAPVLDHLVEFTGEATHPVRQVSLRGLTFSHTDWTISENGYADTQASVAIHGDIRAEFAVDCAIEDCTFSHLSGYGVELGRGCQRDRIVGNEFVDLGAGGVRIGETSKSDKADERNFGHSVTDNHMHQLGRIFPSAVGVLVLQSGQNQISHNHIHDLYYTAISVGWNWGYQETPCRENAIEFNHLHDIGQGMVSDMGAIYTLGIQKGTVVRNNLIHDVNSFSYGGWGLYPDEGSSEILFESNVVYRCKSAGFHQHYGRENIVRNNIFAFGKEHQLMRTREEAHSSFTFTNNIVYFDAGELLGSNWSNENYVMDGNIYFDARAGSATNSLSFSGHSLEKWRARGHDQHSIIADPLFENAAGLDFRLKKNSPAFSLSFHPINLDAIGPRAKKSGSGPGR